MAGRHRATRDRVTAQRQHMGWVIFLLAVLAVAVCCVGFVSCLGIKLAG